MKSGRFSNTRLEEGEQTNRRTSEGQKMERGDEQDGRFVQVAKVGNRRISATRQNRRTASKLGYGRAG